MINLKKKILAGILSGAILLSGGLALNNVQAAEPTENEEQVDFRRHERPELTEEQLNKYAKEIADYYSVNQSEVETALKDRVHFGDIKHAATLAKISGKSFSEVLAMKCDWWQVADKLGITPEKFDAFFEEEMINNLSEDAKLDKKTVKNLLDDHYDPHDISMAGLIANASGKNVKSVISKRKINNTWDDVAKDFNVDLKQIMDNNRKQDKKQRR